MTEAFIADASVAIGWVHPVQATRETAAMLDAIEAGAVLEVPALWPLEVVNALTVLVRRRRLSEEDRRIGLGWLTLAGMTPENVEIVLVQDDFDEVDCTGSFDLVGITAMIQNVDRAYEIADQFRARGVYVVIGGIHPTVLPEEVSRHADTVIVGEAEELWPRFLQDFENGEPQKHLPAPSALPRRSDQVAHAAL